MEHTTATKPPEKGKPTDDDNETITDNVNETNDDVNKRKSSK